MVAIDHYENVRPLSGCLNDLQAFHDYLSKQCNEDQFAFTPIVLKDGEATRDAVVEKFKHFADAVAGEVCVLYFSGHGTRIPTNQFWEAVDGTNEAIVCFDKCLADKELSVLIHEIVKDKPEVHFLVVMDCCNSGTNTREDTVVRLSEPNEYPKTIESYYGFDKKRYLLDPNGLYSAPKGKHLQFGACRSYELAKEITINGQSRGAFTLSLIEALESAQASISYADLEARVQQKIINRASEQRPQLDPVAGAETSLRFLSGAVVPKNRYFLAWNGHENRWEVNAGLLLGVNDKTEIHLTKNKAHPKIEEIFPSFSTVNISPDLGLDKTLQHDVQLSKMGAVKRKVAFVSSDAESEGFLRAHFTKARPNYVQLTDDTKAAEAWIEAVNGDYRLLLPGSERPLFVPVEGQTAEDAEKFWQYVDNVFLWMYVKELSNPIENALDKNLDVKIYRSEGHTNWHKINVPEQMEEIADWSKPIVMAYKADKQSGKPAPASFAVKITNKGDFPIFVSGLYLDGCYGISNKYRPIEKLDPKTEVWFIKEQGAQSSKSIGLGISAEYQQLGLTEMHDYVKIIASDYAFDTTLFEQEPLKVLGSRSSSTRSIADFPSIDPPIWTAKTISFHIIQPAAAQSLADGQPIALQGLKIIGPQAFAAKVALATPGETARDLDSLPLPFVAESMVPLDLRPSLLRSAGTSVVALTDIESLEAVTPQSPLLLELDGEAKNLLAEGDLFMPFVYHEGDKAWYPIGVPGDAAHPAKINHLNEEIIGFTKEDTKGLGKALRLFLYKITVNKPLVGTIAKRMGNVDIYSLALAKIEDVGKDTTYISDVATIIDEIANADRILLFIHGFIGSTHDNVKFVRRLSREKDGAPEYLQSRYDAILTFDYESLSSPIDTIAQKLTEQLEAIGITPDKMEGKTLHVVAHSMGGIVARWWIEQQGGHKVVDHFIQVGSPNKGAKLTRLYDWLMLGMAQAINFVPATAQFFAQQLARYTGLDTIDDNIVDLSPGSEKLRLLEDHKAPDMTLPYIILSGDTQKIDPTLWRDKQVPVLKRVLKWLRYEAADAIIFQENNDTVVAVASAQGLPKHEHIKVLDSVGCDHFAFFRAPAGLKGLGEVLWTL